MMLMEVNLCDVDRVKDGDKNKGDVKEAAGGSTLAWVEVTKVDCSEESGN